MPGWTVLVFRLGVATDFVEWDAVSGGAASLSDSALRIATVRVAGFTALEFEACRNEAFAIWWRALVGPATASLNGQVKADRQVTQNATSLRAIAVVILAAGTRQTVASAASSSFAGTLRVFTATAIWDTEPLGRVGGGHAAGVSLAKRCTHGRFTNIATVFTMLRCAADAFNTQIEAHWLRRIDTTILPLGTTGVLADVCFAANGHGAGVGICR